MKHDKKPDVGYWPTDMGMTEREYEEFVKENNKSGVQKFGEDYFGMMVLFLMGIGLVVMLLLSSFSGNTKEPAKTYNDIFIEIVPKFEYVDNSKVEQFNYYNYYQNYYQKKTKSAEEKIQYTAHFDEEYRTAVGIKATMQTTKDNIILRYLDDNRQLVKLTLKKNPANTYYGFGGAIILKSESEMKENDIDNQLKNHLDEFEAEFYLRQPIE